MTSYSHLAEEFVYVLEGILTLLINNERHELFPGDSTHHSSNLEHS
ncbi:cupin domain-containing protein [Clostridium sp. CF012]